MQFEKRGRAPIRTPQAHEDIHVEGNLIRRSHRVRVLDIVAWHEHQGMTPDEIVSHIPTITLAEVHAALAYYFRPHEEVQEEMRAERAFAGEVRSGHPSLLEAKLRQERLEEAS